MVSVFGLKSCTDDILKEETRGVFTPDFFTTETGVQGGLTYLYQNMRNVFGFAYYLNLTETGTDEYVAAQSANNNFYDLDLAGQGNLSSESGFSVGVVWGNAFPAINTASGIIENAEGVGGPGIGQGRRQHGDAVAGDAPQVGVDQHVGCRHPFGGDGQVEPLQQALLPGDHV